MNLDLISSKLEQLQAKPGQKTPKNLTEVNIFGKLLWANHKLDLYPQGKQRKPIFRSVFSLWNWKQNNDFTY
jgi:hypothetical protein